MSCSLKKSHIYYILNRIKHFLGKISKTFRADASVILTQANKWPCLETDEEQSTVWILVTLVMVMINIIVRDNGK